jgi:hypothetical protein
MNQLFRAIDISKQAFHQHLNRGMLLMEEQQQLLPLIEQIRRDHPQMSSRQMYRMIQPLHMGRDRFEDFCFMEGYKIEKKKAYHRTTDSRGVTRFDNLISSIELRHINQVWVSDITFYELNGVFYYITFIMDLYSRRIVGHTVSDNLMTVHTTLPALMIALEERKPAAGLIFHSDGGGQYYCKEFLKVTKHHHILSSMGENVYENPNAERINGTIKNQYVKHYAPQNFTELKQMVKKAVEMYNYYKPHNSLKNISPAAFENLLTENRVFNKRKKEAKKENNNNKISNQIISL